MGAECASIETSYARFGQQVIGQFFRGDSCPLDVYEGVECAGRQWAPETGDRIQPRANSVAATAKFGGHVVDAILRAFERGDPGTLRETRRARIRIHHQCIHRVGQPHRHHPVAQTPAGHGISLRKPVEDDGFFLHPRETRDRDGRAVVAEARVDFVAENHDVTIPQHGREFSHVAGRYRATSGILRRIENHYAGAVRQPTAEQIEIKRKPAAFHQRNGHWHRACVADHGFIDGEAGIRVDDFIAGIEQRQHGEKHDGLGAGNNADRFRRCSYPARARNISSDGLSKFRESRSRPVFRVAVIERALAGFDNMRRRGKIRLTDFKMNDAAALFFKSAGAHQHFEC